MGLYRGAESCCFVMMCDVWRCYLFMFLFGVCVCCVRVVYELGNEFKGTRAFRGRWHAML